MEEERLLELLADLHAGTPRKGPGSTASTHKALALCEGIPTRPEILDVGCGAGAQTLDLARATAGRVTAVDLFPSFLAELDEAARDAGLGGQVRTVQGDMTALPFEPESFDLLWSEGAIFIMGFDAGLAAWRPLVRPGGCLAVSEVSWLRPDVPEECRERWMEWYPAIRSVEDNLAAARRLGWQLRGHFTLPPADWTETYYGPLGERLEAFRQRHAGDAEALEVAEMTEVEMDLFDRYHEHYGYEFYVLRRARISTPSTNPSGSSLG